MGEGYDVGQSYEGGESYDKRRAVTGRAMNGESYDGEGGERLLEGRGRTGRPHKGKGGIGRRPLVVEERRGESSSR